MEKVNLDKSIKPINQVRVILGRGKYQKEWKIKEYFQNGCASTCHIVPGAT